MRWDPARWMGRSKRAVGVSKPLSARILVFGFMSAESAVMGRRRGCMGMAMSMMTTLFCGEVSRTQMYFSDSMVTWVKVTNCGATPRLVSCEAIVSGSVKATKGGDLRGWVVLLPWGPRAWRWGRWPPPWCRDLSGVGGGRRRRRVEPPLGSDLRASRRREPARPLHKRRPTTARGGEFFFIFSLVASIHVDVVVAVLGTFPHHTFTIPLFASSLYSHESLLPSPPRLNFITRNKTSYSWGRQLPLNHNMWLSAY